VLGSALALANAIAFSLMLNLTPFAYGAGSDPLTLNVARGAACATSIYILLKALGRPATLPRPVLLGVYALGLVMAINSYGILASLAYVPISLAIVTHYTYPMIVAALAAVMGRERLTPVRAAALCAAFAGVALVLQVPGGSLDWRGVGLAFMAALGLTAVFLGSARLMVTHDSRVVTLHLMNSLTLAFLAAVTATGGPAWPRSEAGMLALVGVAVTFSGSMVCLFGAIRLIGPVRTAMLDSSSPVLTILFAMLIHAERLTAVQGLGALLVVLAIVAVQLAGRPRGAPAGAP
ncbi:MAG: DMT family transporter, partial [Alphaproteobacteria bacterium]